MPSLEGAEVALDRSFYTKDEVIHMDKSNAIGLVSSHDLYVPGDILVLPLLQVAIIIFEAAARNS